MWPIGNAEMPTLGLLKPRSVTETQMKYVAVATSSVSEYAILPVAG
jgi:hypothetical protein